MSSLSSTHKLRVGDEVDYACVHGYWLPARVEDICEAGVRVWLRFSVGSVDVTHTLTLSQPADAARIAPMGMRSCPMVHGQSLDFLRQQRAVEGYVTGAAEQWQRAEVVCPNLADRHGGVRGVTLRIASSGDKVLGVSYGAKAPATLNGADVETDVVTVADAALLAPGGTFAKWVPTIADVVALDPTAPGFRDLARRARAFFADSAAMTARLHLGGRLGLLDYDIVDVLPRAKRRRARYGQTAEETLVMALAHARVIGDRRSQSIHGRHETADAETTTNQATAIRQATTYRHPQAWFLGRIKWEPVPPEAGSRLSTGKRGASMVPYVYWFEPCISPDGFVTQLLRRDVITAVANLAPAGTFSVSFVPGMRIETRRVGGCWAFCDVVSADRASLRVRVRRLPRELDRAAQKPKDVPAFGKAAGVSSVLPKDPPRRRGSSGADLQITAILNLGRSDAPQSPFSELQRKVRDGEKVAQLLSRRASKRFAQLETMLVSSGLPGSPSVRSSPAQSSAEESTFAIDLPAVPEPTDAADTAGAGAARAARVARLMGTATAGSQLAASPVAAAAPAEAPATTDTRTNGYTVSEILEDIPEGPEADGVEEWEAVPSLPPSKSAGQRPVSGSFSTVLDFGVKRGRSGRGLASASKEIEVIPHHLWQYLVARSGHFCAVEDPSAPVVAPPSRRGSILFLGAVTAPPPKPTGAVAVATAETLQVANMRSAALPEAARDRLGRRKSVFDALF